MSIFGSSYPPGAENDPYAPYNQDAPLDNAIIKGAFSGTYAGPYDVYRAVYKYVDCGPSVGFLIQYEEVIEDGYGCYGETKSKWIYCDDLHQLGTWADLDSQGTPILAISVSSIVEGVDIEVPAEIVEINQDEDDAESLLIKFWAAVEEVNRIACEIWEETHGCEDCPENPETGYRMIDPTCPACKGQGTII